MIREKRKVHNTKKLLEEGLVRMMEVKSIKHITVCELTDIVKLNRSTFYRYYRDIYDMVEHLEKQLISEVVDTFGMEKKCENVSLETHRLIWTILGCVEKHAELVKGLWSENGDIAFIRQMEEMIDAQAQLWIRAESNENIGDMQIQLTSSYFVAGCLGMIQEWLNAPVKPAIEDMAELMFSLVRNGIGDFKQFVK